MRKPFVTHGRGELAISQTVRAPVGGWNTRDTIADMKEGDAIQMDNWFPRNSDVVVRKGAQAHKTGFAAAVLSLHPFVSLTGTAKLFAATNSGFYDATASGAVGATVMALTSGQVISTQIATSAGNYLVAVNGTDTLKLYDGTTWASITGVSSPAITGVTTSDLTNVLLFKKRLFFLKKNSRSFYYLPADSIAGALTEFACGAYLKKGGYLVGFGSWTIDAGEGADDHVALVSSEGQILLFKGTDPSSTTSWQLIGTFDLGPPLGKKCFVQYGGDLIYLSYNGVFSMTKSLLAGAYSNRIPFSDKIVGAFTAAARNGYNLTGWCGAVMRKESALLFNIPDVDGTSVQYVMNTQTGAWCRFTGWSANCMTVLQDQLYLGDGDSVFMGLTGSSDFDGNIQADVALAYDYFGSRGRKKKVQQLRPILTADSEVSVSVAVNTDFEDDASFGSSPGATTSKDVWDTALWDTGVWSGSTAVTKKWLHTPSKVGYCHSIKLRISSRASDISLSAMNALARAAALAT